MVRKYNSSKKRSCLLLLALACSRLHLLALACYDQCFPFHCQTRFKRRRLFFPTSSEVFSLCYFGRVFLSFFSASGDVPGGLLEHFFVKQQHIFIDFENTSKSMAGAVFQQVQAPRWARKGDKKGCRNSLEELMDRRCRVGADFFDFGCLLASFFGPRGE